MTTMTIPTTTYKWGNGWHSTASAQVVGETTAAIKARDGVCRPSVLVDTARPVDHPLHGAFLWDDAVAGEAWRVQQARQLINSIVVVDGEHQVTQAMLHVRVTDPNDGSVVEGYADTASVMADPVLRNYVLQDAVRMLRGYRARYEHLEATAALAPVWAALDQVEAG